MTQSSDNLLPVGAIPSGPHWPDGVRVEAVTLDEQARLLSRLFRREDLAGLEVEIEAERPALKGDARGFRLAGEEVVPQARYRVTQEGWNRVAEQATTYDTALETLYDL